MIHCVDADKEDNVSATTAHDQYWPEDTGLACYEGDHLKLVAGLAIPLLFTVTVGYPTVLFAGLILNRARLADPGFAFAHGFLFRHYRPCRRTAWETIGMASRALLASVLVFGYELGANLQAALVTTLLVACLLLHHLACPYVSPHLNRLQSGSFACAALVYLSALYFNDPNTSDQAEVIMTVVVMVAGILFVASLLFEFLKEGYISYFNRMDYLLAFKADEDERAARSVGKQ